MDQTQDSIQVFIRVRPDQEHDSILCHSEKEIRLEKNNFRFDRVFPPSTSQKDVFQSVGKQFIDHIFEGYNACVFAYGQTGSGKTYTMVGENQGLMQRSFAEIYRRIQESNLFDCKITCSYFEIYNEQIIDLLDLKREKKLNIRYNLKKGAFIENLTWKKASNSSSLLECLNTGIRNRHVGETMMNIQSSRSHSIFTVAISLEAENSNKKSLLTGKLHFVDLAGSQRQKLTCATGDRLKEAGNINKSLTTLGMVINALASQKKRSHIPFRDSKLTHFLRDSLGGNSKTYVIGTISPSSLYFQETLSTLKFANRAKMIKVKAEVNEELTFINAEAYKNEIRRLKNEITRLKQKKGGGSNTLPSKMENEESKFEQIKYQITQHVNTLESKENFQIQKNLMNELRKINKQKQPEIVTETEHLIENFNKNTELLKNIYQKIEEYLKLKDTNFQIEEDSEMSDQLFKRNFCLNQSEAYLKENITKFYEEMREIHQRILNSKVQIEILVKQLIPLKDLPSEKSNFEKQLHKFVSFFENQTLYLEKLLCNRDQQNLLQREFLIMKEEKKYLKHLQKLSEKIDIFQKVKNQENFRKMLEKMEETQEQYRKNIQFERQKFDEKEEQLLQQISILEESLDFQKKQLKNIKEKYENEVEIKEDIRKQLQKSETSLNELKEDLQQKIKEYENLKNKYEWEEIRRKKLYDEAQESLKKSEEKYCHFYKFFSLFKEEKGSQIKQLTQRMIITEQQSQRKTNLISKTKEDLEKMTIQLEQTVNSMKEMHEKEKEQMKVSIEKENSVKMQKIKILEGEKLDKQKDYEALREKYEKERSNAELLLCENEKMKEELLVKQKSSSLDEEKRQQYVRVIKEKEESRNMFLNVTKENYKLKQKYSQHNEEKDEKNKLYELKYEEKLLENKQLRGALKKSEEKQIYLQKVINYLNKNKRQALEKSNQLELEDTPQRKRDESFLTKFEEQPKKRRKFESDE